MPDRWWTCERTQYDGLCPRPEEIPQGEIVLSLKSVNHRGLDLHFHLPNELDALENDIRAVIKSGVARGHLQIHVGCHRGPRATAAALNRALLDAYMAAFREAAAALPDRGAARSERRAADSRHARHGRRRGTERRRSRKAVLETRRRSGGGC